MSNPSYTTSDGMQCITVSSTKYPIDARLSGRIIDKLHIRRTLLIGLTLTHSLEQTYYLIIAPVWALGQQELLRASQACHSHLIALLVACISQSQTQFLGDKKVVFTFALAGRKRYRHLKTKKTNCQTTTLPTELKGIRALKLRSGVMDLRSPPMRRGTRVTGT